MLEIPTFLEVQIQDSSVKIAYRQHRTSHPECILPRDYHAIKMICTVCLSNTAHLTTSTIRYIAPVPKRTGALAVRAPPSRHVENKQLYITQISSHCYKMTVES